jgi:putative methionine-R-sulfoxide reductase with GAF domain
VCHGLESFRTTEGARPFRLNDSGATRAEATFPVATPEDGQIVGTIDVESDRTDAFTAEDEAFLRGCALALARLWADGAG